jgi:hypothetical protein
MKRVTGLRFPIQGNRLTSIGMMTTISSSGMMPIKLYGKEFKDIIRSEHVPPFD